MSAGPKQTQMAKAAALLRHRALAAGALVKPYNMVARIEHSDRWRPESAFALAQTLESAAVDLDENTTVFQDLYALACAYLGVRPE